MKAEAKIAKQHADFQKLKKISISVSCYIFYKYTTLIILPYIDER